MKLLLVLLLIGIPVVWAAQSPISSEDRRTRRVKKSVKWELPSVKSRENDDDSEEKVVIHLVKRSKMPCVQLAPKVEPRPRDRGFERVCALMEQSAEALPKLSLTYAALQLSLELQQEQAALQDSQQDAIKRKSTGSSVTAVLAALRQVLESSEDERVVLAHTNFLVGMYLLDKRIELRRQRAARKKDEEVSSVASSSGSDTSLELLPKDLTEDYFGAGD